MNKDRISLLKLAAATVAIFFGINLLMGGSSSDIHIHDSYFVMDVATKIILVIIFAAFAGSLILSVLSKFRNKLYNRILLFSILLLVSSGIYIFSLFAGLK